MYVPYYYSMNKLIWVDILCKQILENCLKNSWKSWRNPGILLVGFVDTLLKPQLFVADCDDEWAYGQHDDQYNSRHNRDGFHRDVRDVLAVIIVICYQIFFILPAVQTKLNITIALVQQRSWKVNLYANLHVPKHGRLRRCGQFEPVFVQLNCCMNNDRSNISR